jgi:exportin-2 (importin alpha re-exporter)
MAVFPPLLNPMFWERPGNVPALTRLLVAYLAKAGQELAAAGGGGGGVKRLQCSNSKAP